MRETSGGTSHVEETSSNRAVPVGGRRSASRFRTMLVGDQVGRWRRKRLRVCDRSDSHDSLLAAASGPNQDGRVLGEHGWRLQRKVGPLLSVLLVVLLVSLLAVRVAAQPDVGTKHDPQPSVDPPNLERCSRESLTHRPGWTLSGSWTPDGSTLLVVDILHNQILRYSDVGRSLGTLPEVTERTIENFFPHMLRRQDAGDVILELASGRIVALNPDGFGVRIKSDIFSEAVNGHWNVRSMFLWHPAAGDLITISDLKDLSKPDKDEDAWMSAFVRIPLASPSEFTVLKLPEGEGQRALIDDSEREFYRLGNPYLTALDGKGYVLRMNGKPRIYENQEGSDALMELKAYRFEDPLPDLPSFETRADVETVLAKVEESSMPVGLFGFGQRLFVVTRVAGHPNARWQVTSIDPATDTVHGTASIPLDASHVTVVPGPKKWAFIEKGHAYGFGNQVIDSVYFVPASRFEGELSGDICK